MWDTEQFKEYINQEHGEGKIKEIIAKFKEIVVATILATQDQVYGRRKTF